MTLQARVPENLRFFRWGDERTHQACADGERGPPSTLAEIDTPSSSKILNHHPEGRRASDLYPGLPHSLIQTANSLLPDR